MAFFLSFCFSLPHKLPDHGQLSWKILPGMPPCQEAQSKIPPHPDAAFAILDETLI